MRRVLTNHAIERRSETAAGHRTGLILSAHYGAQRAINHANIRHLQNLAPRPTWRLNIPERRRGRRGVVQVVADERNKTSAAVRDEITFCVGRRAAPCWKRRRIQKANVATYI